MLGLYENFPEEIHRKTLFATSLSNKRLQQALTRILCKINGESFSLEEISDLSIPHCATIFEFGIAEDLIFNYLDRVEEKKVLKAIRKRPFSVMDLFCAVRYYKMRNDGKTALKFDYYMLRFLFRSKNSLEIRVFHERGPRHVSPEDLARLVVSKLNETFPRKRLKPIRV
jgi:hypothetical protein